MLNYTKKYINTVAFCATAIILMIFIVWDYSQVQRYPKNTIENNVMQKIELENIENSIQVEFAYTEIVKNYRKSSMQENEKVQEEENEKEKAQKSKDTKKENHSEANNKNKTENVETDKSNDDSESTVDTEAEAQKLTDIDIYSTNKWRIKIPKIDLDAPISEGTSQESMRRTVGHFEETDKWKGNVALAAHNSGYRCNFFQEIKKLEKGDRIIYSTEKGTREYKVIINKIIRETDWSYIENTKDNRITLITCEAGKREYRRCIQAVEISKK